MKDYVLELASKHTDFNAKLNSMREYLQAYILRILLEEGLFHSTAFVGGTALRFLYNLPRFSEDLDFSLVKTNDYSFIKLIQKVKQELSLAGYAVSATYNDTKTVYYAFIKFEGLLYEVGISPHRDQKFSIKIEVDTKPPEGAILQTYLINKYFPLSFLSYNLSSFFAGKLHALLSRKYTKGRDFFDLGWYLSKWRDLLPNVIFLTKALEQTMWKGELPTLQNWRDLVCKVVETANWKDVNRDVENFLENRSDMNIFTKENVLQLVKTKE